MSDDKVRLFFYGATTTRPAAWTNVREHPHDDALEGVWRPVADDDAREERIEKLRDEGFAMYAAHGDMTRDRDEWKARAEKAEAVRALLREKVREAVFAARDDADETDGHVNAIVARVLGEEAPRG